MKKWIYSTGAKATAILLLILSIAMFIAGCVGTAVMGDNGFYKLPKDNVKENVFRRITTSYNYDVYNYYFEHKENPTNIMKGRGYYFQIKDSKGKVLLSSYSNQAVQLYEDTMVIYHSGEEGNEVEYTITGYVSENIDGTSQYGKAAYWINKGYDLRYWIIAICILTAIISIALFIYLMCTAGYKDRNERPEPGILEKLPLDVYTFLMIMFAIMQLELIPGGGNVVAIIFGVIDAALGILYFMSLATRVKTVGVIKTTLIYRIVRLVLRGIGYMLKNISLVWKTALVITAVSFMEFFGLVMFVRDDMGVFLWFLEKLVLVPLIMYIAIALRKLQKGGEAIAAGDLSYEVDTRYMFCDFKKHGENLNNISQGMSTAVDERMKSERLKTELITNVSHDIKTPLTSIINYVDLIKKEELESDTLREYVDVLDRQSSRLKKLIEDLVEASKASTGNIRVSMEPCEIGVLLNQMQGEYEDRLKAAGLELIIMQPEKPVNITADGRHIWRVLDNLMNNICKYAQPSTRVYITLEAKGGRAVITFKNISKYQLNISADELMERFVRGDASRNTEGSGLGLSIAKSLAELQNGKLELDIDGDLFKAIISFNML